MGMHETEATSTNYLQFSLSRFTATDGGDAGDRWLQALHAISPGLWPQCKSKHETNDNCSLQLRMADQFRQSNNKEVAALAPNIANCIVIFDIFNHRVQHN